tara:strand:+ start:44 stop:256 length:213 start_codon:yes stop_codon:yes gene_type:complete
MIKTDQIPVPMTEEELTLALYVMDKFVKDNANNERMESNVQGVEEILEEMELALNQFQNAQNGYYYGGTM